MLRKILSGFPDLHVMVDTIAKTSLLKVLLWRSYQSFTMVAKMFEI